MFHQLNSVKSKVFYVNTLIIAFVVIIIIILLNSVDNQLHNIKVEVENTAKQLDSTIKSGQDALYYLKGVIDNKYEHIDEIPINYANKVHAINDKGDFALDIEGIANLTGFNGFSKDETVLKEMEISISLTPFFRIVKERNKNYAWVYFLSKYRFDTLYPYIHSSEFTYFEANSQQGLWTGALPKNNPEGKLFVSPLYFDGAGLGLMVTLGQPIYSNDDFKGAVEIDITLKAQNNILQRNNISQGSYFLRNKKKEIIAADGVKNFTDKKIFYMKDLLPHAIAMRSHLASKGVIDSEGMYFIYEVSLKNVPWILHYYKNRWDVYLTAFYNVILIFLLIIILFKVRELIKALEKSNKDLDLLASIDPMTKLYNRRYFSKVSNHIFAFSQRYKKSLSLIMLDIDNFKNINDTYGHHIGDEVIISLSNILMKFTNKDDVIARIGGEEFLILLPETSQEEALILSEKIRTKIKELRLYIDNNIEVMVTVSLGLSTIRIESDSSIEDAISRSDTALYQAKESGRDRICHIF